MGPLRLGVIGCAGIARRRMLPAMAADPDIEIAAIASRDSAKADHATAQYGGRPVTGYAELLADNTIEAVYIPLPIALHEQWVEAALRAGKHVLAEKPLTMDPARTRRLLDLARSLGLALLENVMFVHHSQHVAVRKLVADGAIGRLRVFHACFAVPSLPGDDIRYQPQLGGGSFWDMGVYPIRAALHFLGDRLEVLAATLSGSPGSEVDTAGSALLRAPDGVAAHLSFGMEHAYRSSYELWGSTGRIVVDRAFTPPADFTPAVQLVTADGTRTVDLPPDDQVANTLSAFVTAVRTGTVSDADSMAQANLMAAVRLAALPQRPD